MRFALQQLAKDGQPMPFRVELETPAEEAGPSELAFEDDSDDGDAAGKGGGGAGSGDGGTGEDDEFVMI